MKKSDANPFAPRAYGELHRISDRVYIFRNITNSSFVIGDDGVAVIDTQVNRPTSERLLEQIRTVTPKPIRYVINTHYHWDHTNGNALFKNEGAVVVSSALTKEFMTVRAPRQKEFLSGRGFQLGEDPLLPEKTFEGELALDLGGQPLRLFFAGRAETDDATAVHVERENIVMAGDTVMTGSFPIFGQPVWDEGLEGDTAWGDTIAQLMSFKPAHILPGHGPIAHEAEIALLVAIEKYFIDEVSRLVNKGLSSDEMLKDLEPRLPAWLTSIPVVWGTPRYAALRVYRGLTKQKKGGEPGWQQFKPSAIPAPFAGRSVPRAESAEDFLSMAAEIKEGGDAGFRIAILKKACETFPGSDKALNAYADALIEASRAEASVLEKGDFFQEARRCWDTVLSRDPGNVGALLGKGRYLTMMAYRGGEDPAPGMRLLEKAAANAVKGRPAAEAEFYMGMGFRRLGDEPKAKERFKRALALDAFFMPARLASQV